MEGRRGKATDRSERERETWHRQALAAEARAHRLRPQIPDQHLAVGRRPSRKGPASLAARCLSDLIASSRPGPGPGIYTILFVCLTFACLSIYLSIYVSGLASLLVVFWIAVVARRKESHSNTHMTCCVFMLMIGGCADPVRSPLSSQVLPPGKCRPDSCQPRSAYMYVERDQTSSVVLVVSGLI